MQNRRKFIVQSTLAAGALTLFKPFKGFALDSANGSLSHSNKLTILHTANLNGYLQATEGFGGISDLKKAIANIRKKDKNVLLVDAGDALDGSARTSSNTDFLSALNHAGYDAMVPGNNELANGAAYFGQLTEHGGIAIIATNYQRANCSALFLPYKVIRKGSIKVGIVSLGNTTKVREIASATYAGNVSLINQTASFLKQSLNCNLIVCLTHEAFTQKNSNLFDDISLAESSSNVDVIISGTQLKGLYKSRLVKNKNAEDVIVSTSDAYGASLGKIELSFNEHREKIAVDCNQLIICSEKYKGTAFKKYANRLNIA